jgi:hypothetical protein
MMPDAQGSIGQSERLPVQDSRYKAKVVYEVVMAIDVESEGPRGGRLFTVYTRQSPSLE